jgi:polysulfide reductase-like protein
MMRITVAPEWEWWLVWYFFLGGLAAGLYFIAALIELVGNERDRAMAKVAYYCTFPLAVVCGVLLILDLGRPERFWHMLIQSETGRPMFKYWSPMSVGAWALLVFSSLALLSFVGVMAEDGRAGLGRWRALADALHHGPLGKIFALLCAGVGFFLASYTGVLLAASNQPFWSDTRLLGGLFLASAAAYRHGSDAPAASAERGADIIGASAARQFLGPGAGTGAAHRVSHVVGWAGTAIAAKFSWPTPRPGDWPVRTGAATCPAPGAWRQHMGYGAVVSTGAARGFRDALQYSDGGTAPWCGRTLEMQRRALMQLLSLPGLRHVVFFVLVAITLAGCSSPEDGRPRGGGAGADVGNTSAQFKPESKVFTAAPSR